MAPRTIGAIATRPTGKAQGSYYYFSLSSGRIVNRTYAAALPMPDDVIDRVHAIARRQKANPGLMETEIRWWTTLNTHMTMVVRMTMMMTHHTSRVSVKGLKTMKTMKTTSMTMTIPPRTNRAISHPTTTQMTGMQPTKTITTRMMMPTTPTISRTTIQQMDYPRTRMIITGSTIMCLLMNRERHKTRKAQEFERMMTRSTMTRKAQECGTTNKRS